MMVSKVRGYFTDFSGTIVTAERAERLERHRRRSTLNSIDTRNEQRDNHIRSADFFDVESHPTMTYRSTVAVGQRRELDRRG